MVRIQDGELLALLEENSRERAVSLAKKLGVTETAVRKRIQKLIEKGVIAQFTILTNPEKAGYKEVHLGIDTHPEAYLHIIEELKKELVVKHLYTASGDHMLITICHFPDSNAAERFIKRLEAHEGVTRVCPAYINERVT